MNQKYTLNPVSADITVLDNELKLLNPVCLDILFRRGFTSNESIRDVLFPSFQNAIRPLICQDIKQALNILARAIKEKARLS